MGNGVMWRLPSHVAPEKLYIFRHLPTTGKIFRECLCVVCGVLEWKLRTVHPNPGPRDKTEEGKRRRRERKRLRRQERREERAQARTKEVREIVVVAWNVQRMSLVSRVKQKARSVAEYARKCGWDVVLLSEVWAEGEGVVWMGEEEERVAIGHGERAGVLLRGEALKAWSAEGMTRKISPRHVSVKVKGMTLTATYLPVRVAGRETEVAEEFEVLGEHVRWARKEEMVVVGGDFNAHVGAGEERRGVCGKFGLRSSNQAGRELVDWCEASGLCYVNGFYRHKKRGSWFSSIHKRWYELDGFIMRKEERPKYVRKLNTVGEISLSDHKPKKLVVEIRRKKWRKVNKKRVPRIQWEAMRSEEVTRRFHDKMEEKMREPVVEEPGRAESTEWGKLAEKVLMVAEEVCGLKRKDVENPWMVGKEDELGWMRRRISEAVERRNEAVESGDGEAAEGARQRVRELRSENQRMRRGWEKKWWDDVLKECESAEQRGDVGGLYRSLRKLGLRGVKKEAQGTSLTTGQFKEHFMKVSEERFENSPEEIEKAVDMAMDLRQGEEAEEWRRWLNRSPDFVEVTREMAKMRDSAPGEDGVRLRFLCGGGRAVLDEVVKLVVYMFVNETDKWEESLKTGMVVPLYKMKGDREDANNYRGVCLLSIGSRIVARVCSSRLMEWAEKRGVLDDDQQGFRKGRATTDATQMMMRMNEDMEDMYLRADGAVLEEREVVAARLLDLRKAYPRVNKPALWRLLQRYGVDGDF